MNYVPTLIAGAISYAIAVYVLGFATGSMAFIGAFIGVIGLLSFFNVIKLPINKQMSTIAIVLGIGLLYISGGFTQIGLTTASVAGTTTQTTGQCVVPDYAKGSAATLTLNAYDLASGTKTSTGGATVLIMDSNTKDVTTTPTTETSDTNVYVGEQVDIYPAIDNASYYSSPIKNVCINSEKVTKEIDQYAVQAESSMSFTAKDNDGNALTTGTTGEEDYEISLGAGAEDTFTTKLKNNGADKVYDVCAYATRVNGYVDDLELTGESYTNPAVPKFLKTNIAVNDTNAVNITNYDKVWKLGNVVRLMEWEYHESDWTITADSSNDPVARDGANSDTSSSDAIILALDCDWATDNSGLPVYDFYRHNTDEDNTGLAETVTSPYGGQTGMIIEAV